MKRERGMVTAEMATIAPFGIAFVLLLLWIVSLGLTQVRIADASREAARMIARGESTGSAEQVARDQSPVGSTVKVESDDGTIIVTVRSRSSLPVPFFTHVGSRTLESTSVAAKESP